MLKKLLQLQVLLYSVLILLCYSTLSFAKDSKGVMPPQELLKQNSNSIDSSKGYYKDVPKRGWWWYEDPTKEKPVEEKKEEKPKLKAEEPKQEEKKEDKVKPLYEYSYEELLRMPIEQFKKIYEHYENLAVSNPTEENVYMYYNVLDVARKKSLLFTMQSMYVWQKYPELSTARDVPTVVPGIYKKQKQWKVKS